MRCIFMTIFDIVQESAEIRIALLLAVRSAKQCMIENTIYHLHVFRACCMDRKISIYNVSKICRYVWLIYMKQMRESFKVTVLAKSALESK